MVALLVVSCCAWALPGAKKQAEVKTVTETTAEASAATTSESSGTTSQSESELMAQLSESLLETLRKSNFVIGTEKIEDITEKVEVVLAGIDAQGAIIEEQSKQIEALEKKNKATRFFADFGVAVGFKDEGVTYGATADMGLKFGKGLLFKVGTTYMIGEFKDIKNVEWSLNNLICTATIGWEW